MRTKARIAKAVAIAGIVFAGVLTTSIRPASAAATDFAVDQAACTEGTGTATPRWGNGGLAAITPPVVASMTINGETVPTGEIKTPTDHHLGIAICPGFDNARIIGLNIFHREGSTLKNDLTGALLPSGATYNANMTITITITNWGTQAQYFSYPIIHGTVSSYTTSGLGTSAAAMTVSLKAARLPILDFTQPGANLCTATPPVCSANKSDFDVTAANMAITMDPAATSRVFDGSYFALVSATGGFVTSAQLGDGTPTIKATLGSSHFLSDGTTPNVGSMQAYLPNNLLASLLGLDAATIDASDLSVDRTDADASGDAAFTITPVTGGAVLGVTGITFSTPVYNISKAGAGGGNNSGGNSDAGYRLFASDGGVFNYGNDKSFGSAGAIKLAKPVVGGTSTSTDKGYWLAAADGGVFNYGDASFFGSAGSLKLAKPIVGFAATPTDKGYWLVASDGGVFAYGDAKFYGSLGATKLNSPIVGMTSTPTGKGYWLVAADGGVFAYGDAKFYGSLGATKLNSPIVGMTSTTTGLGYWLVAADGGVFAYGDAKFYGSHGNAKLNSPVTGIVGSPDDKGYVMTATDGGIFNYGDFPFVGSAASLKLAQPVVGIG